VLPSFAKILGLDVAANVDDPKSRMAQALGKPLRTDQRAGQNRIGHP
jgi:hypothetical protein